MEEDFWAGITFGGHELSSPACGEGDRPLGGGEGSKARDTAARRHVERPGRAAPPSTTLCVVPLPRGRRRTLSSVLLSP